MTIIADPEERQALEALCDWLATKCAWPPNEAPAQNAYVILQDALTKPEKADGLRETQNSRPRIPQAGHQCAALLRVVLQPEKH